MFCDVLWPKMASKTRQKSAFKSLSPSAVFQEIQSYIKGAARALDTPKGHLSREEYLYLGAKMAPNFKGLSAGQELSHVPGDHTHIHTHTHTHTHTWPAGALD